VDTLDGTGLYQRRKWDSITNALTNGDAKLTTPASLAAPGEIIKPADDNPIKIFVFSRSDAIQYDDDWAPLPATAKYPANGSSSSHQP